LQAELVDKTGLLIVNLRDAAVREFFKRVTEVKSAPSSSVQNFFSFGDLAEVSALPCNSWNGECLSSMRIVKSIGAVGPRHGTHVGVSYTQSPSFLSPAIYVLPSGNVCISNSARARSKIEAPFRGTFKGTVVELQDADYSSQGNQKRHFKLVDPSGLFFECCALGKNAGSVALAESIEVVLYFVTGRGPIGGLPALLYLMKSAAIVPLQMKLLPPLPRTLLVISKKDP